MPGPLPNPQRRRRNPPAVPTTTLPASGRKGRPPNLPVGYALAKAGREWWKWAWGTPQAAAWDAGARYVVARRASLEDDLAVLDKFDPFELADLLGVEESERTRELGFIIGRLKALAGDRVKVMKEMRELDSRLGLTPEALAKLRWTIQADAAEDAPKPARHPGGPPKSNVRRLRALDPAAAAAG